MIHYKCLFSYLMVKKKTQFLWFNFIRFLITLLFEKFDVKDSTHAALVVVNEGYSFNNAFAKFTHNLNCIETCQTLIPLCAFVHLRVYFHPYLFQAWIQTFKFRVKIQSKVWKYIDGVLKTPTNFEFQMKLFCYVNHTICKYFMQF